jgi:hypothetical protein
LGSCCLAVRAADRHAHGDPEFCCFKARVSQPESLSYPILPSGRGRRKKRSYRRHFNEANQILRQHNAAGFVDVFNGKDFTGWGGPVNQYEVKDGAIVCQPKKGGTIYTQQEYADFAARVDFRLPPAGNNGLAIRYPGQGDSAYLGMCEVQILDDDAPVYAKLDPRQFCGSAYGMVPVQRGYLRPQGQWNFMEVTVVGPTLRVEINGTRVLNTDLNKVTEFMANKAHPGKDRTSGHFGVCGHNDPVAFRNIQIKPLEKK